MRIQDTQVWNDPLVQETIACIGEVGEITGGGDVNDHHVMQMLLETDCFDPLAISTVMAGECGNLFMKGQLPASVVEMIDLVKAERVREEGPAHLFKAGNVSALRFVLAEFASEATGEAYRKLLDRPDFADIKPHIDAGAENVVALADGLVETGLWREMPPKLLDKFIESMENVRYMVESSVLKRGVSATIASFKTAIAEGTAQDIASAAPRIDPNSQYAVMKHLAKTKYRLQ